MSVRDVVELVESTWNNTLVEKRLAQLKVVRNSVASQDLELFDSLVDAKVANVTDRIDAITVLLVHGIQTDGAWHKLVEEQLKEVSHLNVKSIGYECVTAFQLASPWRAGPIRKVTKDIRDAIYLDRNARFVVIAHSFGTYILSKILCEHSDIEFERIILCGSIIPITYRWELYAKKMPPGSIVNDVGTRDFYPVLATCSSLGYGASGRKGFQTPRIKDRYFDYGHSDFFEPKFEHIKKFWKPILTDGQVVDSSWDSKKPKTSLMILMLCHPWIGRALSLLFVSGLFALIYAAYFRE